MPIVARMPPLPLLAALPPEPAAFENIDVEPPLPVAGPVTRAPLPAPPPPSSPEHALDPPDDNSAAAKAARTQHQPRLPRRTIHLHRPAACSRTRRESRPDA
jgi:hypothetical protein